MLADRIKSAIREVPDFPKPGISFKDITPLLEDADLCEAMVEELAEQFKGQLDAIVGVESRGFLLGMLLANKMRLPFVPVRKKGKLPWKTISHSYALEYGTAEVEMHVDSIRPEWRVLVHDDLLATGGTAVAASELVQRQGGIVSGYAFVVNLSFLEGEEKLKPFSTNIVNLLTY